MKSYFQPAFILRCSIAIAYIVFGGVLLYYPLQNFFLRGTAKVLFAVLLIVYGLFRMYRAIKMVKEEE
ncbi:MAG: hypothetical protein R2739_04710 [Chitinophagales bacterium]|nr:hypothetical protein [Bacteroidota bacterium]